MKIPASPPKLPSLTAFTTKLSFIEQALESIGNPPTYEGHYIHWDELQEITPDPKDLSNEGRWFGISVARAALGFKKLPCRDQAGKAFQFLMPDIFWARLSQIDQKALQFASAPLIVNQESYSIQALMDEAICSCRLEGNTTTYAIAKEILLKKRQAKTPDEEKILRHYQALLFVQKNTSRPLSLEFIHEMLRSSENEPILKENIEEPLSAICDFANQDDGKTATYVHPVVKAILLHFMIAALQPFLEDNGQFARLLFYWFIFRHNYKLIEYLSLSQIIQTSPTEYQKAFLYVETDNNDVSYFIDHQLKIISQAIETFYLHIAQEKTESEQIQQLLNHNKLVNKRQLNLIKQALKNPEHVFLIEEHRQLYDLSYQTARTDLLGLRDLKLLNQQKKDKAFVFVVPLDFKQYLKALGRN
jgi:Fic family protein